MATFSTDQVRQFYVVLEKAAGTNVSDTDNIGTTLVKSTPEDVYLHYKSPNADIPVRSDLVNKRKVMYAVATRGKVRPLGKFEVTFSTAINGGAPIAGQEYLVRISHDFLGTFDHKVFQYGNYIASSTDTVATVLQGLADSINQSKLTGAQNYVTATSTGTELVIEEIEAPWVLGKKQSRPAVFNVFTSVIEDGTNVAAPWGEVTNVTATNTNTVDNGKSTADMEWFYYGERGDIYRGVGFPNNFDSKYIVDPSKHYDFIEICYYYSGDTEDVQKSKKVITLAVPSDSTYTINTLAADLTAAGITVDVSKL